MKVKRRLFLQQFMGSCLCLLLPVNKNHHMINQGIITRISPYEVKETIDKLVIFLEKNGATIYCRINQQNEVRHAGREILPMEFILFGNPANGSAIMEANPLAALDLPLKIIAWKGNDQVVRVAFNDPAYLQNRYALPSKITAALNLAPMIEKALAN